MEDLDQRWRDAVCRPFHPSPIITDAGLLLGYETALARRRPAGFDLSRDADRILCLLSVVGRGPGPPRLLEHVERALARWAEGERCLAHIHLAFARLRRLEDHEDARRLFVAGALLDGGLAPRELAKGLGIDLPLAPAWKYDPDQPRNPAGSGAVSGQWTNNPTQARTPSLIAHAPGLADPLGEEALAWLARLAGRIALPAALFGAAFIPSPNPGVAEEGDVPGRPGMKYRLDHDTGLLRLSWANDSDPTHALVAQLGADGVYREVETSVPIARSVGGQAILIDLDRTPSASRDAAENDDGPKLCPEPKPDKLTSRKLFDELYEQYVRDFVNPQRKPQLPPDLTFALAADTPAGIVYFDDCREADGTMIEAKGNYAKFLTTPWGKERLAENWRDQADRQVAASRGRRIEWYFHDATAADFARVLFSSEVDYEKIRIFNLPYPGGVPKPNPRIRR